MIFLYSPGMMMIVLGGRGDWLGIRLISCFLRLPSESDAFAMPTLRSFIPAISSGGRRRAKGGRRLGKGDAAAANLDNKNEEKQVTAQLAGNNAPRFCKHYRTLRPRREEKLDC